MSRYIVVVAGTPKYTTETLQKAADACHSGELRQGVEMYVFDKHDRIYYDAKWDGVINAVILEQDK